MTKPLCKRLFAFWPLFFALLAGFCTRAHAEFRIAWTITDRVVAPGRTAQIAMDPQGNFYTVSTSGEVDFWTVNGRDGVPVDLPGIQLRSPQGIALDDKGALYLSDTENGRVIKLDVAHHVSVIGGFGTPGSMVGLEDGVLVVDTEDNSLKVIDGGGSLTTVSGGLDFPIAVARDKSRGILYYCLNHGDDAGIYAVRNRDFQNPEGIVTKGLAPDFSHYHAMAVDGAGDLYYSVQSDTYKRAYGSSDDERIRAYLPPSSMTGLTDRGFYAFRTSDQGTTIQSFRPGNDLPRAAVCVAGASPSYPCSTSMVLIFDAGDDSEELNGALLSGTPPGEPDFSTEGSYPLNCVINGPRCELHLVFSPKAPGLRTDKVSIYQGYKSLWNTTTISGTGMAPVVAFPLSTPQVVRQGAYTDGSLPATDLAGNFYYSSIASVLEVTPAGSKDLFRISDSGIDSLTVDGQGSVFFTDTYQDLVWSSKTPDYSTRILDNFATPTGIVTDVDGSLLVTEGSKDQVIRYSFVDGSKSIFADHLNSPRGLAVDADGTVYVTEANGVRKFPRHSPSSLVTQGMSHPVAVAVDPAGDILTVDEDTRSVKMLPADGSAAVVVTSSLSAPYSMALNRNADLYVSNRTLDGQSVSPEVFAMRRSSPEDLVFNTTTVGAVSSDSPRSFPVMNTGNLPLHIASVQLASATEFQISVDSSSSTCHAGLTLKAGATCFVSINFKPSSGHVSEPATDMVTLVTDSNNIPAANTFSLSGKTTLLNPQLAFTPTGGIVFQFDYPKLTASSLSTGAIRFRVASGNAHVLMVGKTPYLFPLVPGPVTVVADQDAQGIYAAAFTQSNFTIVPGGASMKLEVLGPPTADVSSTSISFMLTPGEQGFLQDVSFSVEDLPAGYSFSLSPPKISAGASATKITLVVSLNQNVSINRAEAGEALALLCIPIFLFRRRRCLLSAAGGRLYSVVLLSLLFAGSVALMSCGGKPGPVEYPLTLTASNGGEKVSQSVIIAIAK